RQLDLAHEANLAAWYSSALLLMGGVIALIVAWLTSLRPTAPGWKQGTPVLAWALVGAMLVALSADEVSQFHEWTGNRVPHHLGANETVLGLHTGFRWLLVLAPFIA